MPEYDFVTYEELDDGAIVRIMLNRPDARNAQNRGLLVELDQAFGRAEEDDRVRVVILGGNGLMFSSGHDLGSKVSVQEYTEGPGQHPSRRINGATREGAESLMLQEWHYFYENNRRWRNLQEDHRRPGARRRVRRRSHADVGVRPDRRRRRNDLR